MQPIRIFYKTKDGLEEIRGHGCRTEDDAKEYTLGLCRGGAVYTLDGSKPEM